MIGKYFAEVYNYEPYIKTMANFLKEKATDDEPIDIHVYRRFDVLADEAFLDMIREEFFYSDDPMKPLTDKVAYSTICFGYSNEKDDFAARMTEQCFTMRYEKQASVKTGYVIAFTQSADISDSLARFVDSEISVLRLLAGDVELFAVDNDKTNNVDKSINNSKKLFERNGLSPNKSRFLQRYLKKYGKEYTEFEQEIIIKKIDAIGEDYILSAPISVDGFGEDYTLKRSFSEYMKLKKDLNDKKPVSINDVIGIYSDDFISKNNLRIKKASDGVCVRSTSLVCDSREIEWTNAFSVKGASCYEKDFSSCKLVSEGVSDIASTGEYPATIIRVHYSDESSARRDAKIFEDARRFSTNALELGIPVNLNGEQSVNGLKENGYEACLTIGGGSLDFCGAEKEIVGDKIVLIGSYDTKLFDAFELRSLLRLYRDNEKVWKQVRECIGVEKNGVAFALSKLAMGVSVSLDTMTDCSDSEKAEYGFFAPFTGMIMVIDVKCADEVVFLADEQNLEARVIGEIIAKSALVVACDGKELADISKESLNFLSEKNYAECEEARMVSFAEDYKNETAEAVASELESNEDKEKSFFNAVRNSISKLSNASKVKLMECFDCTAGNGTIFLPYGGKAGNVPVPCAVVKQPIRNYHTNDAIAVGYAFGVAKKDQSVYSAVYSSVIEAYSKLLSTGVFSDEVFLAVDVLFGRIESRAEDMRDALAVSLALFQAQKDLELPILSVSLKCSDKDIDISSPIVTTYAVGYVVSDEAVYPYFDAENEKMYLLTPKYGKKGLPNCQSFKEIVAIIKDLKDNDVLGCISTIGDGGLLNAVYKMMLKNERGFLFDRTLTLQQLQKSYIGAFIISVKKPIKAGRLIGCSTCEDCIEYRSNVVYGDLTRKWNDEFNKYDDRKELPFKGAYKGIKTRDDLRGRPFANVTGMGRSKKVLIPIFPGTTSEYDSENAFREAEYEVELLTIRTKSALQLDESVDSFVLALSKATLLLLPGGASGGDEPIGAGKYMSSFLRNPKIASKLIKFVKNDKNLICGICNGFQALLQLGCFDKNEELILPEKEIVTKLKANVPNGFVSKFQSLGIMRRYAGDRLANCRENFVWSIISHSVGMLITSMEKLEEYETQGLIFAKYTDDMNLSARSYPSNPNSSYNSVESLVSVERDVFGKMAHFERLIKGLYLNFEGPLDARSLVILSNLIS